MSLNTRSHFMMVVAIGLFIFSVLWGLAPYSSINLPARFILDVIDWPMGNIAEPLDRNTQWLTAIAAGILAALAIFLGGIVAPAIKQRNTSVTRTALIAILAWYVIDSAGSYASGVASNVFFNTLFLALLIIPLIGVGQAEER